MPADDVNTRNTSRWRSALATTLLMLFIALVAAIVGGVLPLPPSETELSDQVFTISLIAFPILGWLLVVRGPRSPLGWLYLVFPLVLFAGYVTEQIAFLQVEAGRNASPAVLLLFSSLLISTGYWTLFGPALLLFPDGRIPDRAFRWALAASAAAILVLASLSAVGIRQICVDRFDGRTATCAQRVDNPLAFTDVPGLGRSLEDLHSSIILTTLGISLAAIISRYRRSQAEIQHQIKWVAWVASLSMLAFLVLSVFQLAFGLVVNEWLDVASFMSISIGMPAAIGVAIFKFRLYDIDRIISRTAAYSLVAAVLLSVFGVSVAVTQRLLPFESQLGVVISTLVVAALFNPLRGRVQQAVDRRFNRSRYDARQVLDEFSTHVRDDVELEPMQAALLRTARKTLEPAHLSLWVREPESVSLPGASDASGIPD